MAAVIVDQQRRLREIENLRQGRHPIKPIAPRLRSEAEIIDCVTRLVRRRPRDLQGIRSLLESVETLCGRSAT